jgi:diadenosine tetraphosphate (Ap4A) HIT family hydrolase
MSGFELDPRLLADTHYVLDAALSRLLLMDDARWPWLILVPRIAGLREVIDLDSAQRMQLMGELDACGAWLRSQPRVHKLNIAALGNVVPQLHIHVLGRWPGDPAWPAPVWGAPGRLNYGQHALRALLEQLRGAAELQRLHAAA